MYILSIRVVQSARIAGFRGNWIPLPSSGGSQHNQSNSNTIISPINAAAHNIPSLATTQPHHHSVE